MKDIVCEFSDGKIVVNPKKIRLPDDLAQDLADTLMRLLQKESA
jgi:hypothetical protein